MKIKDIDHITLTVTDLEATLRFYHEVFDMPIIDRNDNQHYVLCGKQAIKFQVIDKPNLPIAKAPTPGAADFCIIVKDPLEEVENHLKSYYVDIVEGPVNRIGAHGPITSIYVRDPDQNLIEISEYH
ncbi:lactoylglutathione lyase family protein [Secundilactobacillus oryzae JCM 18671]|uniref:Lactoylglutathione lyase family protein n=1 Tax=Secundilactobacillus oryzae JCM 18671 TaxID=1291743 RepID=A0A081BH48_9LACO|nr:VOC family protein [Secundilactobacillus oryzae]GAK47366.1 lactoylglutathione lyase family protein [Secundilactobacillus oryzae JCM 18671]